jgi:hypothetical protein
MATQEETDAWTGQFFGRPERKALAALDAEAAALKARLRVLVGEPGEPVPVGWHEWEKTKAMGTLGDGMLLYTKGALFDAYVIQDIPLTRICWEFRAPMSDVVEILKDAAFLYERKVAVERMGT